MSNTLKKLGDAELEIMQIIWNSNAAVTSNQILKELQERRKWQLSTLMTSLSRLSEKGFVNCDRSTGTNLYTPIISENDYKTKESKNFLQKLYNNRELKNTDMAELRKFLDDMEDQYSAEEVQSTEEKL